MTEDEQKTLILLYVGSCTERGESASEADIRKVLEWATGVRNEAAMLDLVFDGMAEVHVEPDGIKFSLTEEGRQRAKERDR
jgi:hypothetical protein